VPLLSDILRSKFPYEPTLGQKTVFALLDQLTEKNTQQKICLLIKGYAGTGKTTIISALTDVLPLFNLRYVLMAPTGRAAKVMNAYSKKQAFTIHKIIYNRKLDKDSGEAFFSRSKNYFKDTVFIIDEASMISDTSGFMGQNLIRDLIEYVYENSSNKMIIIGDSAQLPPVGSEYSPGLEADYLISNYHLTVKSFELTEVVRQEQESGILINATDLRNNIKREYSSISIQTKKFRDIFSLSAEKLEDGLRYAYEKFGIENTSIICRSNWQAVQYNQLIRRNILFFDDELEAGDILMAVKNNYFYLDTDSEAGFIANGDFLEVRKIINFEEKYGFRFATLQVKLVDYPEIPAFDVKVFLDTLYSKTPTLSSSEQKRLYDQVVEEVMAGNNKRRIKSVLQRHEYLNALQVKFAYALTCHKSQGGQWNIVFVDQGIRGEVEIDKEYMRWLYTAITRATNELYLINFDKFFFKN